MERIIESAAFFINAFLPEKEQPMANTAKKGDHLLAAHKQSNGV